RVDGDLEVVTLPAVNLDTHGPAVARERPAGAAREFVATALDPGDQHALREPERVGSGPEPDQVEEVVEPRRVRRPRRVPRRDDGAPVAGAEAGAQLERSALPPQAALQRRALLLAIQTLAAARERVGGGSGRERPEEELLGARAPRPSVDAPLELRAEVAHQR